MNHIKYLLFTLNLLAIIGLGTSAAAQQSDTLLDRSNATFAKPYPVGASNSFTTDTAAISAIDSNNVKAGEWLLAQASVPFPKPKPDKAAIDAENAKLDSLAKQHASEFNRWLYNDFYPYALKKGLKKQTLDIYLPRIQFNEQAFYRDNRKVESTITFKKYKDIFINDWTINKSREMLNQNYHLLSQVYDKTGVPPEDIIAFWAMESGFGKNKGKYNILDATATIAKSTPDYKETRRREFYQYFYDALWLVEQGHLDPDATGSYVGASGHFQFMPSNIRQYAVDASGDGFIDFWNAEDEAGKLDIFMSAANFLVKRGKWVPGQRAGRQVEIGPNFSAEMHGPSHMKSLQAWRDFGITTNDGEPIPVVAGMKGYIAVPEYQHTRPKSDRAKIEVIPDEWIAFIFYENANSILKWNWSYYFVGAHIILADAIRPE